LLAVKVSPQALFLQVAAAQEWGVAEWRRLDAQTAARPRPDSMAQTLGRIKLTCHFSSTPFQDRELAMRSVRELVNSYAIKGVELSTAGLFFPKAMQAGGR